MESDREFAFPSSLRAGAGIRIGDKQSIGLTTCLIVPDPHIPNLTFLPGEEDVQRRDLVGSSQGCLSVSVPELLPRVVSELVNRAVVLLLDAYKPHISQLSLKALVLQVLDFLGIDVRGDRNAESQQGEHRIHDLNQSSPSVGAVFGSPQLTEGEPDQRGVA